MQNPDLVEGIFWKLVNEYHDEEDYLKGIDTKAFRMTKLLGGHKSLIEEALFWMRNTSGLRESTLEEYKIWLQNRNSKKNVPAKDKAVSDDL